MADAQKRLESKERLKTIVGGYCYAQDGGNGGYEFGDIVKHIDESIQEAVAEEKARVVGILEQRLLIKCECEYGDCANCDRLTLVIDNLSDFSSLDKPVTDKDI